jgi:hypothetical protein
MAGIRRVDFGSIEGLLLPMAGGIWAARKKDPVADRNLASGLAFRFKRDQKPKIFGSDDVCLLFAPSVANIYLLLWGRFLK